MNGTIGILLICFSFIHFANGQLRESEDNPEVYSANDEKEDEKGASDSRSSASSHEGSSDEKHGPSMGSASPAASSNGKGVSSDASSESYKKDSSSAASSASSEKVGSAASNGKEESSAASSSSDGKGVSSAASLSAASSLSMAKHGLKENDPISDAGTSAVPLSGPKKSLNKDHLVGKETGGLPLSVPDKSVKDKIGGALKVGKVSSLVTSNADPFSSISSGAVSLVGAEALAKLKGKKDLLSLIKKKDISSLLKGSATSLPLEVISSPLKDTLPTSGMGCGCNSFKDTKHLGLETATSLALSLTKGKASLLPELSDVMKGSLSQCNAEKLCCSLNGHYSEIHCYFSCKLNFFLLFKGFKSDGQSCKFTKKKPGVCKMGLCFPRIEKLKEKIKEKIVKELLLGKL